MKIGKIFNRYIICGMLTAAVAFGQFGVYAVKKDKDKEFTVVIDAGHGGHDTGAVDNGVKEKDINLAVAQKLSALIAAKMKDAEVVMTRKDDTFITLQQRADIANNAKGNLFISIHTNSLDKSNPNRKNVAGASVYALGLHKDGKNMDVARRENSVIEFEKDFNQKYCGFDPNKDESYIIFEMAQKKNLGQSLRFAKETEKSLVTNAGRNDRGVKQAGFWVLWATSMPSVLIELDFICNPQSAEFMASDQGREKLADAIFKALQTYRESLQNTPIDKKTLAAAQKEAREAEKQTVAMSENNRAEQASKKEAVSETRRRGQNRQSTTKRRRRSESAKTASEQNIESSEEITISRDRRPTVVEDIEIDENPGKKTIIDDQDGNLGSKKGKKDKSAKKDKKKKKDKKHKTKLTRIKKVYKIQLLASGDRLKQNNPRFCGFGPISAFRENNLYKYTYGESESMDEIEKMLREVKKKIPDAFIISLEKEEKDEGKKGK